MKYIDYSGNDMTWRYTRGQRYMEQYHFTLGTYNKWGTTRRVIGIEWKYSESSSSGEWLSTVFDWFIPTNNNFKGMLYCRIWDTHDPHGDIYNGIKGYSSFRVWYIE